MQHVNRAGSCSCRCCCCPLQFCACELNKLYLLTHWVKVLPLLPAMGVPTSHAPASPWDWEGKTACLRFSSCTSLFSAPPTPSHCSLGSLFVSSLFVRRKYPALGRDASTSSGRRHDELLSDGIRVCSSQIVKLSNCMSIYSLASTLLPLP